MSASGPQVLPGISSTWEWQVVPGNTWPQATIGEIGRPMTRIIIRENENVKNEIICSHSCSFMICCYLVYSSSSTGSSSSSSSSSISSR